MTHMLREMRRGNEVIAIADDDGPQVVALYESEGFTLTGGTIECGPPPIEAGPPAGMVYKETDLTKYRYAPWEEAAGKRYVMAGSKEGRRQAARDFANHFKTPCTIE